MQNTNVIMPLGLIRFEEGIGIIYNLPAIKLNELKLKLIESDGGFILGVYDKDETVCFGVPVDKIFQVMESSKQLSNLKVGLYSLNNFGEFIELFKGFTLTNSQIYEIKGMMRMIQQTKQSSN
jgi:hypothetical protein